MGLSGMDISAMSDSEHQAFSLSVIYTGEQSALFSRHITPRERASCIQ